MDTTNLLATMAFALAAAATAAAVAAWLRQSVILGYLVAGIMIGANTPGFVADQDTVNALADVGIILLMFTIGIQVSAVELLRVGRVAIIGGHIQVALTIGLGFLVAQALGWPAMQSLVFGAVVSNSSSTVLSKVLGDRGEAGSVHGQMSLAWSSVQDLNTIFLIVVITALSAGAEGNLWRDIVVEGGQAALFLALLVPIGARVLPIAFMRISALQNREVFILVAASLAIGVAYLATLFGLSPAIGAFVAGIVLSESDVRHEILGELLPLRDIFAGLFFVSIGMLVDPGLIVEHPIPVFATVATIVLGKSVIVGVVTWAFGYPARTALLTGVTLAQSAEFSFVMLSVGVGLGEVGDEAFGAILAGTAIAVLLAPGLQDAARPLARWLEQQFPPSIEGGPAGPLERRARYRDHVVICGYGRVGRVIGDVLRARGIPFIVIDQNRYTVQELRQSGVPALLGSADNPMLLDQVLLERARLLVVAIPEGLATRRIVEHAQRRNPGLRIVARTHSREERDALERLGVAEAVLGELELAIEMTRYALTSLGLPRDSVLGVVEELRRTPEEEAAAVEEEPEPGSEPTPAAQ